MNRLLLAAVLASSALPLRAQVQAVKPAERPSPSCVCDQPGFKAITDKAEAVEAYWQARRKMKIATVISGTGAIFSLMFGNPHGAAEASESFERARSEMWAARAKAESLGALKVTGDDMDGKIEFRLKKGADYVID